MTESSTSSKNMWAHDICTHIVIVNCVCATSSTSRTHVISTYDRVLHISRTPSQKLFHQLHESSKCHEPRDLSQCHEPREYSNHHELRETSKWHELHMYICVGCTSHLDVWNSTNAHVCVWGHVCVWVIYMCIHVHHVLWEAVIYMCGIPDRQSKGTPAWVPGRQSKGTPGYLRCRQPTGTSRYLPSRHPGVHLDVCLDIAR